MRDWNACILVVLHILHQEIRVGLSPVPRAASMPRSPTEVSSVALIAVGLHKTRRAPSVGINCFDAVAHGLLAQPDLSGIVIVP